MNLQPLLQRLGEHGGPDPLGSGLIELLVHLVDLLLGVGLVVALVHVEDDLVLGSGVHFVLVTSFTAKNSRIILTLSAINQNKSV